jgi:signal peptidase I
MSEGFTVNAGPEDVSTHIEHLKKFTYMQMLEDVKRDYSDRNLTLVRIVADMRLARTTVRTLIGTWAAVAVAIVAVVISVGSVAGWWSSKPVSPVPTTTAAATSLTGQVFYVPSGAMVPTLAVGDYVVVRNTGTVRRGDIIVFKRPPADIGTTDADLIKRVIGLPGETISSRGNTVLINGKPLSESWLPRLGGVCAENAENIAPTKIAPDHYFVMGDCRGDSADSRVWGTLAASLIVGKVVAVIKP